MCPGSGWVRASKHATVGKHPNFSQAPHLWSSVYIVLAKKRYQAVGFPFNRMLKLSSSKGIRIDVPVLSVSWSVEDHSLIIQALSKGLIEHEASDTGGVPRWECSCPDRLAGATISRYFSELCWRSLAEKTGCCCRLQQIRPLPGVR